MTSRSDALVLFGATGDLTRRKLLPALYRLTEHDRLEMPVVGVARSDWNDDSFRAHAAEAIRAGVADADPAVIDRVCARLSLVCGDYSELATFDRLAALSPKAALPPRDGFVTGDDFDAYVTAFEAGC